MTPFSERIDALRAHHGHVCAICDAPDFLEFAHILPTPITRIGRGRGGNNRIADITNHPDAYVLMCRTCHVRYDVFVRASKRLRNLISARGHRWYLNRLTRAEHNR